MRDFLKKTHLVLASLLVAFSVSALPATSYAVDLFPNEVCDGKSANSTACKEAEAQTSSGQNPLFGPNGIITRVIFFLSIIIGVAAVVVIILAGFKFITSGSNQQEVTRAREMLLYAIVGLIVAAAAQIIVNVFLNTIG